MCNNEYSLISVEGILRNCFNILCLQVVVTLQYTNTKCFLFKLQESSNCWNYMAAS